MVGRDVAQPGRAPRSGRGGQQFKSARPDHLRGGCASRLRQAPTIIGGKSRHPDHLILNLIYAILS